jgi:biopolymer transport protein ExbD
VITIDVDFDGTVLWNGEIMPDRATIETRLTEAADEGVVILQDTPST